MCAYLNKNAHKNCQDHVMNISDNHFFIKSATAIETVIQPLSPFGVYFFVYMKNYKDGSQIHLSNKAEWIKNYYSLKFCHYNSMIKDILNYTNGTVLWSIPRDSNVFLDKKENYNRHYGIAIIEQLQNSNEFYFFSSARKNSSDAINFYHRNVDIFERFKIYFKDRADKLLKKAEKAKIIIPGNFNSKEAIKNDVYSTQFVDEKLKEKFVKETRIYRYTFTSGELKGVKLSAREIDCLFNLANNLSATESAKYLNISPRTVESYLNNIKVKLNCNKQEDIFEKLRAHHLYLNKLVERKR